MNTKLNVILTLLLAFVVHLSFAQSKMISGIISDENGLPLAGVNILVKGSLKGTQTDFDGKYSISAKTGDVLVYSFLGYANQEMAVGSKNTISFSLQPQVSRLDEIVVTAYGNKTSRSKLVSSYVQVSSENINNRPNVNVLNSLQGQAAGVNISSSSGQPGTNKNNVVIRGVAGLSSSSDPLYVVDGVPQTQAFFRNLNANEIESVTVLKDASSTAIYGNRGSNGVIVINTKSGKFSEGLKVGYSSSYGLTQLIDDKYNLGSALDQLRIQQKGFNEGVSALASALANSGSYLGGAVTVDPDNLEAYTVNTDWKEYFYRDGITQTHDGNFSLGSDKLSNYTNFGYLEQDGIVPTTGFKRFTLRSNFKGKSSNEKFNYGLNISLAYSKRNQLEQETRSGINNNVLQNPLTGYLTSSRFLPADLYQNGQQLLDDFGNPSLSMIPYMLLDLFQPNSSINLFDEYKTQLNFNGSYAITNALTFGIRTGIDYSDDKRIFAIGPEAYLSVVRASGANQPYHGFETISSSREFMFNHVNNLTYEKDFAEKHNIKINVYSEYLKAHRRSNSQRHIGLNPLTWSPGAGTGYINYDPDSMPLSYRPSVGAFKRDAGLLSFFSTADYDFDDKYGLSASIRRDGSYRFVGANKWGTFWSVGGRWNIDKESFMSKVSFIDDLKLRGSYGTTGNQNVVGRGVDSSESDIFLGSQLVRDLNSSSTGYFNSSSFAVSSFANTDLKWETTIQYSFGIDYGLFNNRITGSVDYYNRYTDDLYQFLPVSAANGFPGNGIRANSGDIRNSGIEVQGTFDVIRKSDFKISVSTNFAYNKDQFEDLGTSDTDNDGEFIPNSGTIRRIGGPLREYHLVRYVGVNPANGNLLFLDKDDQLTENPTNDDRVATGKSLYPTIQGGFGLNIDYNGFFLNSSWSYVTDIYRFDWNYASLMDARNSSDLPVSNDLYNAWTPTNRITDVPALAASNIDLGNSLSDRFLRDASYLRLRNLSFGYSIPTRLLEPTFFKQITFRLTGENIVTFSKWKGLDPERSVSSEDLGFYPTPRIYTFGIDFKF